MTKKEMCNNLKCLTGLNTNQVDELINTTINVVIHSVVDYVSERTDGKLKHIDIEIPYIGILNADITDDGYLYNISLSINDDLSEKFKNAIVNLESPLIEMASNSIGRRMVEKYKSLF